eukprot:TRINITY_DN6448_c0_g1_i1.p1 TRINITY_DN6448_c0_g1~~TRINITY_DN6448_c0_g1_i1.p1  ORF type:complete len:299 (+),score=45.10 TRINITY_DN6448_c0_g1_i1:249-1145(+)
MISFLWRLSVFMPGFLYLAGGVALSLFGEPTIKRIDQIAAHWNLQQFPAYDEWATFFGAILIMFGYYYIQASLDRSVWFSTQAVVIRIFGACILFGLIAGGHLSDAFALLLITFIVGLSWTWIFAPSCAVISSVTRLQRSGRTIPILLFFGIFVCLPMGLLMAIAPEVFVSEINKLVANQQVPLIHVVLQEMPAPSQWARMVGVYVMGVGFLYTRAGLDSWMWWADSSVAARVLFIINISWLVYVGKISNLFVVLAVFETLGVALTVLTKPDEDINALYAARQRALRRREQIAKEKKN